MIISSKQLRKVWGPPNFLIFRHFCRIFSRFLGVFNYASKWTESTKIIAPKWTFIIPQSHDKQNRSKIHSLPKNLVLSTLWGLVFPALNLKISTLEKGRKTQYAPLYRLEYVLQLMPLRVFRNLKSDKDERFCNWMYIKNSFQLSNVNVPGIHFPENCRIQRFWERFKARKLYLTVFLYFLYLGDFREKP